MKESALMLITSHMILEASNNSKSLSAYYVLSTRFIGVIFTVALSVFVFYRWKHVDS